jgi:choline-sulfatase
MYQLLVILYHTRTGSPGPPTPLPTDIPNLASVMKQAGYRHVQWYGKWHVGGTPADYGFQGWKPPDAGNYLIINDTLGGGEPNNDGRFLNEVCRFLREYQHSAADNANEKEPFCVVTSFVNPHDVYVAQYPPGGGYTMNDFQKIQVPLPCNFEEDTDRNNKPRAQGRMSIRSVTFDNTPQDYVNFYAYLHTVVDTQIGILLDTLDQLDLTDSTLIVRTADHGEQALSHSLVEKFYNCYQESIHIPLVISNPVAFPEPLTTTELTSHIDILPTLASLCGMNLPQHQWKGKDLMTILENSYSRITTTNDDDNNNNMMDRSQPSHALEQQCYVHFTYDDIECHDAPSILRCIRTEHYKYAVYFTSNGLDADWEMYFLDTDPLENNNVAGQSQYASLQRELDSHLYKVMIESGTLPKEFPWPPSATPHSRGSVCRLLLDGTVVSTN